MTCYVTFSNKLLKMTSMCINFEEEYTRNYKIEQQIGGLCF